MTLKRGKTVELNTGEFLRIENILQDRETTEVFLVGKRLQRTKALQGYISPRLNEVCWVRNMCSDRSDETEKTPLGWVIRLRQARSTNRPYVDFNGSHLLGNSRRMLIKEEGVLFCRYKFITIYSDKTAKRRATTFIERYLGNLSVEEADHQCSESRARTRQRYGYSQQELSTENETSFSTEESRLRRRLSSVTLIDGSAPREVELIHQSDVDSH